MDGYLIVGFFLGKIGKGISKLLPYMEVVGSSLTLIFFMF